MTTRRELLKAMAVGAVTLTLWPRAAWSSSVSSAPPLLLIVMLRGGLDGLHMSFYQDHDIGDDHEWDIWRLEGPTFVWHFRGSPHVHTWLNVARKA